MKQNLLPFLAVGSVALVVVAFYSLGGVMTKSGEASSDDGARAPVSASKRASGEKVALGFDPSRRRVVDHRRNRDAPRAEGADERVAADDDPGGKTQEPEVLSDDEILRRETEQREKVTTFYESRFESEAVDSSWAGGYEREIADVFAGDEMFEGNRIEAVDCRGTLCRLEVAHESDTSRERMRTPWGAAPFAHGSFIRHYPERNATVIFLGREGHPFAMPSQARAKG